MECRRGGGRRGGGRAALKGVPLGVDGPPARCAAGSGRTARKGVPPGVDGPPARECRFQWTGRPQGIPLEGGRAGTSGTSGTSGMWQGARLRATPFASAKHMLPRKAIHWRKAYAAAPRHSLAQSICIRATPLACATPASLFLVRSTTPGTIPEVSEVSAQAPVRRSGLRAFPVSGLAPFSQRLRAFPVTDPGTF